MESSLRSACVVGFDMNVKQKPDASVPLTGASNGQMGEEFSCKNRSFYAFY